MKNKPTLAFYAPLFSIFILLLSFGNLIAQENGFYELKDSNSLSKESSKKTSTENRAEFYDLTYNLHSTAYIENSNIKIGGNSGYDNLPITKLTFHDTKSFSILNQSNAKFNNVELMTIKILTTNDLSNRIDLTDIRGLNQLKYIYVECYFECTESQIKEFIISDNPDIRIFYKVSKPS